MFRVRGSGSVFESGDTHMTSARISEKSQAQFDFPFRNLYSPIFRMLISLLKLQAVFESPKCIPQRKLRPISLSNSFTMEWFSYLLS